MKKIDLSTALTITVPGAPMAWAAVIGLLYLVELPTQPRTDPVHTKLLDIVERAAFARSEAPARRLKDLLPQAAALVRAANTQPSPAISTPTGGASSRPGSPRCTCTPRPPGAGA